MSFAKNTPENALPKPCSPELQVSYDIPAPNARYTWASLVRATKVGGSRLFDSEIKAKAYVNAARLQNFITRTAKADDGSGWRVWIVDRIKTNEYTKE